MSAPASDNREEYLVIGPSQAGKTCLVGVLDHASATESLDQPARFEVFPEGAAVARLFEQAAEISRTGKLPWQATFDVTCYQFLLKARAETPSRGANNFRPPVLERSKIRKHLFQLLDGPGEKLFPDETASAGVIGDLDAQDDARDQLIKLGQKSKGVIICLDASDTESGGKFFRNLLPTFRKMATDHVLPFERVALVLTKADRVFAERRRDAEQAASQADPWAHTEHLLGGVGIKNLLRYLDTAHRPAVCCGWTSVYGFVPGEGSANYDDARKTLLVYDEKNPLFFQKWIPFRVLDPFVYLATGEPLSLRPIPAKWLK